MHMDPLTAAWSVYARSKVQLAVKRGELVRASTLACADCGAPAVEYDHRDYGKPLEVAPVCRPCNRLRGAAAVPAQWPPKSIPTVRKIKEHKATKRKRLRLTGSLGGRKGGVARAAALTPERRREIALLGVAARKAKREAANAAEIHEVAAELAPSLKRLADTGGKNE